MYTRVENLTLPITIIRCDYSKESHTEYLFTIFHRLNTGGVRLNNQEIRNCIFSGNFNLLLFELNKYSHWLKLFKLEQINGTRFAKQEMILRLFCFNENYEDYGGRLASYLNNYMRRNRNLSEEILTQKKKLFQNTVDIVVNKIFDGKPPKLTLTVLEAILVGVSRNLPLLIEQDSNDIKMNYEKIIHNEEFSDIKLREGLSGKQRVIDRLNVAVNAFAGRL